eukprot:tig00020538_g10341.t1
MKLGKDPHSWANFEESSAVTTEHLHVHVSLDFDKRLMRGYVDVHARVLRDGAGAMLLDAKGLAIEHAEVLILDPHGAVGKTEDALCARVSIPHTHSLGHGLRLPVPPAMQKAGSKVIFRVHYHTTDRSGGIQWLDGHQTASGKPFAFTQFQAILARTCIPCQDTTGVKATFSIQIRCPLPLVAVCSGECEAAPQYHSDGTVTYAYRQRNPIAAYLIAIACGALANEAISARCRVYAEEAVIAEAVHEFRAETEAYIKAGEEVTGVPYEWGRYDMVVLPGSFPYGGMENPNLTFLSRSLLAGDRSLTSVVAHEITHSWAGNLVTNSEWESFWLNEGFTVYIERLILGHVHGSAAYRDFESLVGFADLKKTVADLAASGQEEYTKLVPDLEDVDPDDAFSKVPYEKGSLFLRYLEKLVGGPGEMRAWLKEYFTAFMNKTVSVQQMREHFEAFFGGRGVQTSRVDWDTWMFGAGLPDPSLFDPSGPARLKFNASAARYKEFDTSLIEDCRRLAALWKAGGEGASASDIAGYHAKQARAPPAPALLLELGALLGLRRPRALAPPRPRFPSP